MSERKNYIGKKRRKIFSIEKNYSQPTPKNELKEKVDSCPEESLLPSEEVQTSNPLKLILNLNEINEKNSVETQKHSLINISRLVFEFLKTVGHTTGNEVTNHIKNVIYLKNNDQPNQKNIQRRVYDAINVMCAAGLVKKNRQEIQFIKHKAEENNLSDLNEGVEENKEKDKEKSDEIDEKIKQKSTELEEKNKKLIKNYLTLKFYEKYNKLNETCPQRKLQKKLEFPFDLIKYDSSNPIKITQKEDASRYLLLSNSQFEHLTPYDIIKKLISPDIFLKLNENLHNISGNKSNGKKSTNDNSLIEEANYNMENNSLFNSVQEENKVEESPKKRKVFPETYTRIKYVIPKEPTTKKRKEEKEDDLVFDYLKNNKSFIDDIINCIPPQVEANNNENDERKVNEEEAQNFFEKENAIFNEKRPRKNSDISNWSNLYDESEIKNNKGDLVSELEIFMKEFK